MPLRESRVPSEVSETPKVLFSAYEDVASTGYRGEDSQHLSALPTAGDLLPAAKGGLHIAVFAYQPPWETLVVSRQEVRAVGVQGCELRAQDDCDRGTERTHGTGKAKEDIHPSLRQAWPYEYCRRGRTTQNLARRSMLRVSEPLLPLRGRSRTRAGCPDALKTSRTRVIRSSRQKRSWASGLLAQGKAEFTLNATRQHEASYDWQRWTVRG
ncbi:unnamed protein product [Symbiodinium natans]|uniref:Uncharacterized protein n=1 Tax=Symbiodinium natans TaxID=878477 RepID=A0A812VBA7_9DINO|nr:unnamed protein product [Symbiodinium natans]